MRCTAAVQRMYLSTELSFSVRILESRRLERLRMSKRDKDKGRKIGGENRKAKREIVSIGVFFSRSKFSNFTFTFTLI